MSNNHSTAVIAALLVIGALCSHPAVAQRNAITMGSEYDRNSLSVLILDRENSKLPPDFLARYEKSIQIGSKFFVNHLGVNLLSGPFKLNAIQTKTSNELQKEARKEEQEKLNEPKDKNTKLLGHALKESFSNIGSGLEKVSYDPDSLSRQIEAKLEAQNIGAKIMGIWSRTDQAGNFAELIRRVDYNQSGEKTLTAKDKDKISNFRGLFYRNYIIVLDFNEIITIEEYYRRTGTKIDKDTPKGFACNAAGYVYRLNVDEKLFEAFIKPNFDNKEVLLQHSYDMEFVCKVTKPGKQTEFPKNYQGQYTGTDSEVYGKLMSSLYSDVLFTLEQRLEAFKAKARIVNTDPIKATIGEREEVEPSQRAYLYAYVKHKPKRVAVVRAFSVGQNMDSQVDASGNVITSTYRQVWGRKVQEGAFLVQQKDVGLCLGVGYAPGEEHSAANVRLEVNLHRLFGRASSGSLRALTGLHLYGEMYFESKTAKEGYVSDEFSHYGIGLSKRIYKSRFINLEPFAGYYFYGDKNNKTTYYRGGLRIPIAIMPNLFLSPEISFALDSDSKSGELFAEDIPVNATLRFEF